MGNQVSGNSFSQIKEFSEGVYSKILRAFEDISGNSVAYTQGENYLSPNFQKALFQISEYLTLEENFRIFCLDKTLNKFLSNHVFTWRRLFQRVCLATGELNRYEAECSALAERNLCAEDQVKYLQEKILFHLQEYLDYEERHYKSLLQFNTYLYDYCKSTDQKNDTHQTHGLLGLSSNLMKFSSRDLASCLSLKRKNAANFCIMETMLHPSLFKSSIKSRVGRIGVSYFTLDLAQRQAATQQRSPNKKTKVSSSISQRFTSTQNQKFVPPESRSDLENLDHVPGFIGYAVNLVQLRSEHESILRDTACWNAFMHLAVFQTQSLGQQYASTLYPEEKRENFWFCGLDFVPPEDRRQSSRYRYALYVFYVPIYIIK